MKYPIHEMFHSFQGEGVHAGKSAFFIRLFGCPIHCPWCDSAGTWHPKHVPSEIQKLSASEIASEVFKANPEIVVVTGGEPLIHNLTELCEAITDTGERPFFVHLETSGCAKIMDNLFYMSWITVSPKRWGPPTPTAVKLADEFKFIIEAPEDIEFYRQMVETIGSKVKEFDLGSLSVPIWLHPEWSKRQDPLVLAAITRAVKGREANYRAGYQLHKLYQADAMDSRSRPLVPLGGNPEKGY